MKISARSRLIIFITAVVVCALTLIGVASERYFSSTGYCTGCHSMTYPYAGTRNSVHYARLGADPECGDCHIPPGFPKRLVVHFKRGVRDAVSEFRHDLSTREYYELYRVEFREKAIEELKSWDSAPCMTCHKAPRPSTEAGRKAHREFYGGKRTCVDCHQGIYH
jgi:nitrate/TMAO reductase-like tetraheme cytochrome c subunit